MTEAVAEVVSAWELEDKSVSADSDVKPNKLNAIISIALTGLLLCLFNLVLRLSDLGL